MSSAADPAYETRLLRSRPGEGLRSYVSLTGVASLSIAGLFYLWGLRAGGKAWELDGVQDIGRLEDLLGLVQTLPALVAIRGRVNSHVPKKCELCDKQAVIHEVVEEEVWRKQRSEGRTVYEPFETRKVFEECEWFVEDGSGVRVKVENALQADRLRSAMEYKSEFVGEDLSKTTLGKVLMEKAWQMTKHGMRKTERYLPVGALVTCVGELSNNHIRSKASPGPTSAPTTFPTAPTTPSSSKPDIGRGAAPAAASAAPPRKNSWLGGLGEVFLGSEPQLPMPTLPPPISESLGTPSSSQPSHSQSRGILSALKASTSTSPRVNEDMPFVLRKPSVGPSYITPLTLGQLKAAISNTAVSCRFLAYVFGAVGTALIVRKVLSRLWQRARERRIRQRVAAAETARKARQRAAAAQQGDAEAAIATDNEEYVSDRSPNTCVVCLEERVDMVFTACGHMCVCVGCGLGLDKCPICRIRSRAIKVYSP